ncbi:MAG: ADP-dependent glucokinase/phosphofructokinase [Candidatus Bathyarchaeia archaeon]
MDLINVMRQGGGIMDEDSWNLRYSEALSGLASRIDAVEGIITAYNTNIDAIYRVRPSIVEDAVKPYSREVLDKIRDPPRRILDEKDLLAGLILCMREGLGEEWLILDPKVSDRISEYFIRDELRMGGQAGNMANALASLGVPLIIPHVVQLPEMQADLFIDGGRIQVPQASDGEIVLVPVRDAVRPDDEALIHHVFEFSKGGEFLMEGSPIEIPRDNRFIATYDDYNTRLIIDPSFRDGVEIAGRVDGAILAGYHFLREDCIERIEASLEQIREWRRLNPRLFIHLELGCTPNPRVRSEVVGKVFPLVDSVGLNEHELVEVMGVLKPSHRINLWDLRLGETAPTIYEAARILSCLTAVGRLTVHTKDYSLRIVRGRPGIQPERELHSLLSGSAVAASYAAHGRHMGLDAAASGLKGIPISPVGIREFNDLAESLPLKVREFFRANGYAKVGDAWLIFSVNRDVEDPATTTGLGDSMTAAMVLADASA